MEEIHFRAQLDKIKEKKVYPEIPLTPEIKEQLEKNKDSVMHQEMKDDLIRFTKNLPTYEDDKGIERIKCEISSFMIPVRPKSMRTSGRKSYRENLEGFMEQKKASLEKFKDFEIVVYIISYLSKERYSTDVDNIAKPIVDAMKLYFQDDSRVKILIVEKKLLNEKYPADDLKYLENFMVIIVDAMVRNDIIKI